MSSEITEEHLSKIQSILGRLNELQAKTEFDESELNEIKSAPDAIAESLKILEGSYHPLASALISSLRGWGTNFRDKKIKSAVEGLKFLKAGDKGEGISDDQLDDLIDLDETVVLYLETRMYGSNIFTAGLVMELHSLKKFRESRKTSPGLAQ